MGQSSGDSHKYDFDWAFGWNRLGLDFMGFWPRYPTQKLHQLRAPLMMIWITLGLILPQIYALSQTSRELFLVMDNLITNIGGILAVSKLIFIWNNRSHIRPMVECVREDWNVARKWSWELDVMVKQAARARIFTLCGYSIMLASISAFLMTPFFGINIRTINNFTDPYGNSRFFPLQSIYPFDAFGSPYFEFIYFTQIASAALAAMSISVTDFFFGALAFHTSAQFEILTEKFKMLFPENLRIMENCALDGKNSCWEQLRQAVLRHVHLIRFAASLENLFNLSILSHVISLYVIMCSLGFGIVTKLRSSFESTSLIQVLAFGGTSLDLMIHMLVYCLASEVLVHHSSGVHKAVYKSGWYSSSSKYSQNIILIMMRAKIPLQLTAGKFFNLSLSTYCTITKTVAGYISVILAASS